MEFRPADSLRSRTFIGLLIAQFLAAFNDQAIHAAAMFFAFHKQLMNEAQAISLMPILFYAPWAIFCTLAGYLADRFSKRQSLVFWKFAEIAICLVALVGFWLGDHDHNKIGPILVLACVFLMGTHSAFFVPAKYGAMPEILQPQLLSRGNGILESLSFLAVILGTVCGGVLSSKICFQDHETWIGVVFLVLAIIGALASLWIEKMPPANPQRKFPPYLYKPLGKSLKTLLGTRPMALAAVGIAFFTFVVAYMRQSVYMLGESQNPRWDEWETSLIVGTTALGIGLGSPLAGWLSGRKIELGLVPLGGIGMVLAAVLAAVCVHWMIGLVAGIILIGFFAGFYLVPLYTQLQHRSPKTEKGDMIAGSNFLNVTGAILASVLFFALVSSFQRLGMAPLIPFVDGPEVELLDVKFEEGRLVEFEVAGSGKPAAGTRVLKSGPGIPLQWEPLDEVFVHVDHAKYKGVDWYYLRMWDDTRPPIHDNSGLPSFLFLGAAGITALILIVLCWIVPDLPRRASWAARTLFGPRVRAIGTHHVPLAGAVVLTTNCKSVADCRNMRSATDRLMTFFGAIDGVSKFKNEEIIRRANDLLARGQAVALTEDAMGLVTRLHDVGPVIPVYVGTVMKQPKFTVAREVRVSFGRQIAARSDASAVAEAIRAATVAEEDTEDH